MIRPGAGLHEHGEGLAWLAVVAGPPPCTRQHPSTLLLGKEHTIVTQFSFLVDKTGAIHVRPFEASTSFTSLELSTLTGRPFAKSPGFER